MRTSEDAKLQRRASGVTAPPAPSGTVAAGRPPLLPDQVAGSQPACATLPVPAQPRLVSMLWHLPHMGMYVRAIEPTVHVAAFMPSRRHKR